MSSFWNVPGNPCCADHDPVSAMQFLGKVVVAPIDCISSSFQLVQQPYILAELTTLVILFWGVGFHPTQ